MRVGRASGPVLTPAVARTAALGVRLSLSGVKTRRRPSYSSSLNYEAHLGTTADASSTAAIAPHFTVRPMHPYAAGSCSSTASTTLTINPEQLGSEKSSVAAQRAAALDPVNTAARAPVSSACRRSSWARKTDSHLARRCLPVLLDREGTSLGCGTLVSSGPGSLRSRLSWSYGV